MHHNHNNLAKSDEKIYQCPECTLWYGDKQWAKKCEAWCKEHKSCNLEIISHSAENNKYEKRNI